MFDIVITHDDDNHDDDDNNDNDNDDDGRGKPRFKTAFRTSNGVTLSGTDRIQLPRNLERLAN